MQSPESGDGHQQPVFGPPSSSETHATSAIPHGSLSAAILIVGPTGVGKTAIALAIAPSFDAEIVSVDSRLFYRGMDIGTAKPTLEERARVRHHLIDIDDPHQTVGLVEFQRWAAAAMSDIVARGKTPLLVGGTGQYVRALTTGWKPPSVRPHQGLRSELQRLANARGKNWLHERLDYLDDAAARLIDPRNVRRTVRALEVILSSGRRFSDQRDREPPPYRFISIGLRRARPALYARIDARIEDMWEAGLLDETRRLLHRAAGQDWPAMSAIGYSQCNDVIRGRMKLEQAKAEMRAATRALVRRQSSWFRETDPAITWFEAGDPVVLDRITAFLRRELPVCVPDNP